MSTSTTSAAVRTLTIDAAHSEVVFQVRHLVTKVRGRFREFDGTVQVDEQQPAQSAVNVTIQASSIDTAQPDRDAHLRSADFFAVDQFPTLTFASTAVTKKSDESFDVTGNLTIHGVTRQVVLPMTFLGTAKDPWGNQRYGFEAELTLNRKDYGLTWNAALETGGFLVGDEVKISLQIQAIAK
jgi:polyisoprenoid-binding protein YceI